MKYRWKLNERLGKKRHGVNRERSHLDRKAYSRALHKRGVNDRARARYRAIARLYWSGAVPDWQSAERQVDGRPLSGDRSGAAA